MNPIFNNELIFEPLFEADLERDLKCYYFRIKETQIIYSHLTDGWRLNITETYYCQFRNRKVDNHGTQLIYSNEKIFDLVMSDDNVSEELKMNLFFNLEEFMKIHTKEQNM